MKPTRGLILLDLDMTLIDKEYNYTLESLDRLRTVIGLLEERNISVGLNSDTPIQSLRTWSRDFGISGPLVAENGQIIATSVSAEPRPLTPNSSLFDALRKRVMSKLLDCGHYAFVACGDVTHFKAKGGRPWGVDRDAFLVNGLRQCSFSMYALRLESDRLQRCDELMAIAEQIVRDGIHDVGLENRVRIEPNTEYGIIIVHETEASKSLGVRRLMELIAECDVFMVGDSTSDIIRETVRPVRMCAVDNACDALKTQARLSNGFIAGSQLTTGVVEILNAILQTLP